MAKLWVETTSGHAGKKSMLPESSKKRVMKLWRDAQLWWIAWIMRWRKSILDYLNGCT